MDVNVIPVPEPVVHISGTSDISREYEDFKLGVRIFADVHIVMTTGSPTGNGKSCFGNNPYNLFVIFKEMIMHDMQLMSNGWTVNVVTSGTPKKTPMGVILKGWNLWFSLLYQETLRKPPWMLQL